MRRRDGILIKLGAQKQQLHSDTVSNFKVTHFWRHFEVSCDADASPVASLANAVQILLVLAGYDPNTRNQAKHGPRTFKSFMFLGRTNHN